MAFTRSTRVILINKTPEDRSVSPLEKVADKVLGNWVSRPPDLVGAKAEWVTAGEGGTAGSVAYEMYRTELKAGKIKLLSLRLEWRNSRFFNTNFYQSALDGSGYSVVHFGGDGDDAIVTFVLFQTGLIYAIDHNKDLLWFHHEGRDDGTFRWSHPEGHGQKVGNLWDFEHVFSGGDGVIYAIIRPEGDLLWFCHEGRGTRHLPLGGSQGPEGRRRVGLRARVLRRRRRDLRGQPPRR